MSAFSETVLILLETMSMVPLPSAAPAKSGVISSFLASAMVSSARSFSPAAIRSLYSSPAARRASNRATASERVVAALTPASSRRSLPSEDR